MTIRVFPTCVLAAASCLIVPCVATAQEEPFVAPYVPTVEEDVELMLDVARVRPDDYVIDLGSGDGRIVIAAARRGALGHGIELDPELVSLARANAREAGVTDRVAFDVGDIFEADISHATVVSLYLFPEANLTLRPKLLAELRPGTRLVSNSFHMDDWRPDVHDMSARSSGGILLWIIPARIDGNWILEIEGEENIAVAVRQRYQDIELELTGSKATFTVDSAALEGARIRFAIRSAQTTYVFDGSADDDGMQGYVQIERGDRKSIAGWRATRR